MIEKCLPFKAGTKTHLIPQKKLLTKLTFAFPSVTMHLAYFALSLSTLKIIIKCLFHCTEQLYFKTDPIKRRKVSGSPRRSERRDGRQKDGSVGAGPQAAGPDPHSAPKAPATVTPMGIRILRQWKDGVNS